jgi:hypothetical protein
MASYIPDDLKAVLAELETETDRAVAIVGASLIEHYLENAIQFQLRPIDTDTAKGKEERDRLYGVNGIFAGISAKIVGAYAMQMIGPTTRRDLEIINKIRNRFAHDMNPVTFDTDSIRARCNEIDLSQGIEAERDTPRARFLMAIQIFSVAFWLLQVSNEEPDAKDAEPVRRLAS